MNFKEVGIPHYTPEEHAFAREMLKHYENPDALDGAPPPPTKAWGKELAEYQKEHGVSINECLLSLQPYDKVGAGSTDVGDVSWNCPAARDPCGDHRGQDTGPLLAVYLLQQDLHRPQRREELRRQGDGRHRHRPHQRPQHHRAGQKELRALG